MPMKPSGLTGTDQFCGCGGSSLGATMAGLDIRQAMNHWKLAVDTHNTNFPNTHHDCADMSAVNPRRYHSTDFLITSPECTHHTNASGKKRQGEYESDLWGNKLIDPEDERSRATMHDVLRFSEYHNYNIVIVENVVEAEKWVLFPSWLQGMSDLGYDHEILYLNSNFFLPTPQSRDRMYVVFWKKGNKKPDLDYRPYSFCDHCQKNIYAVQVFKKKKRWGKYKSQYLYRCPSCAHEVTPYHFAGFDAIDFSIPSVRIGDRKAAGKQELKPKTMKRVEYGWEKYGKKVMIVTGRYTSGLESRVRDAETQPLPTQPGDASHAVVMPWMVEIAHSQGNGAYSYDGLGPMPTATSAQSLGMVAPYIVETGYSQSGDNRVKDSAQAIPTQSGRQSMGLVQLPAGFISKQFGGDPGSKNIPFDAPLGAITTVDHHALIEMPLGQIVGVNDYDIRSTPWSEPLGTQTTSERFAVVAPSFIANMHGNSNASPITDPLMCVSTSGSHHALISTNAFLSYYNGSGALASGMSEPIKTVTGSDRISLVQRLDNMTVNDLYFRMLVPKEIKKAMAFPDSYVILGNGRQQVKQSGNAVTPPVMAWIVQQCAATFQ